MINHGAIFCLDPKSIIIAAVCIIIYGYTKGCFYGINKINTD